MSSSVARGCINTRCYYFSARISQGHHHEGSYRNLLSPHTRKDSRVLGLLVQLIAKLCRTWKELIIWLKMRTVTEGKTSILKSQTLPTEKKSSNSAHTLYLEKKKLSPESFLYNSHSPKAGWTGEERWAEKWPGIWS